MIAYTEHIDQFYFSIKTCSSVNMTSLIFQQSSMKWLEPLIKLAKTLLQRIKNNSIASASLAISLILIIRKIATAKMGTVAQARVLLENISDFYDKLHSKNITAVNILKDSIHYKDSADKIYQAMIPKYAQSYLESQLRKNKITFSYGGVNNANQLVLILVIWIMIGFLFYMLFKPDRHAELNTASKPQRTINFSNVIGLEDSKQALREIIDYMKNPQKFNDIGARMRKGIIFYGPSGTGKTTLAKATAGQANVPFFSCNASEFCEIYVGVGPKRVKDLFKKAKEAAPSIIYIDEIDAIGNRKNMGMFNDGAGSQKNSTINQLLSEMDGFSSQQNVLVIGSTNRVEMIDQSLLRAGRFDLKIRIPLPNEQDRFDILKYHLSSKKYILSDDYLHRISTILQDWSGADLQNLANESVYAALRTGNSEITEQIFTQTAAKLRLQLSQ